MKIDLKDLTKEQAKGVTQIKEFLKLPIDMDNPDTRVIVLQGQAGTGKTTMLKIALEEIIASEAGLTHESIQNKFEADLFNKGILGCIGVTVSHKAKKVLSNSIPICTTYASYFGLIMKYNEFGDQIFVPNDNPKVLDKALCNKPHKVAVHDEVSMYDKDMIDYLLKNTDPITKIILVGDPGQIPPIKQADEQTGEMSDEDSPAFTMFSNKVILTEKVRQTKGNPIIELSDLIYNEIFGSHNLTLALNEMAKPKFNDGIGYEMLPSNKFLEKYINITKDFMDSKIISYRNDTVDMINRTIRNFVYNNPMQTIIGGELIYMKNTFSTDRYTKFYNSDEYIISNVQEVTHKDVPCYQAYVDRNNYPHLSKSQKCYLMIPTPQGDTVMKQKIWFFDKTIREADNYNYKMAAIARKMKFLEEFSQVSYGYCFTAHKIQGSTYKNVFVYVNDILSVNISNKRKLQTLYTAITRASHSVYFIY